MWQKNSWQWWVVGVMGLCFVFTCHEKKELEGDGGPSKPLGFEVIPEDRRLRLEWDPPKDIGQSQIVRYEYNLDGKLDWQSMGLGSSYVVEGLQNHRTYMVRIRAVNSEASGENTHGEFAQPSGDRNPFRHHDCKSGGAGTLSDPYIVCAYEDLLALHSYPRLEGDTLSDTHIALGGHIDATPSHVQGSEDCVRFNGENAHLNTTCRGWMPLPHLRDSTFKGRGFRIFGLYSSYSDQEFMGFFSRITHHSTVEDVHFRQAYIYSYEDQSSYLGVLAGEVYFDVSVEDSSWIGGEIRGEDVVGGMVGILRDRDSLMSNIVVRGRAGEETKTTVRGRVVGGIVGRMDGSTLLSAFAHAAVHTVESDDDLYAGGVVGVLRKGGQVSYVLSISSVNSDDAAGGLVGRAYDGAAFHFNIAAGRVRGEGLARGFIAHTDATVKLNYNYWDPTTTEQENGGLGGTGEGSEGGESGQEDGDVNALMAATKQDFGACQTQSPTNPGACELKHVDAAGGFAYVSTRDVTGDGEEGSADDEELYGFYPVPKLCLRWCSHAGHLAGRPRFTPYPLLPIEEILE